MLISRPGELGQCARPTPTRLVAARCSSAGCLPPLPTLCAVGLAGAPACAPADSAEYRLPCTLRTLALPAENDEAGLLP